MSVTVDGQSQPINNNNNRNYEIAKEARLTETQGTAAGNMIGEGIIVIDHDGDGIVDSGSAVTPVLSPPMSDVSLARYQEGAAEIVAAEQHPVVMQTENEVLTEDGSMNFAAGGVTETENGLSKTWSDAQGMQHSFNADYAQRSVQYTSGDGDDVQISFAPNSETNTAQTGASTTAMPTVSINGVQIPQDSNEVGIIYDFYRLMELFHEMGVEQRSISRQARNVANTGVVEQIRVQAGKQREAATNHLIAGAISGASKIGSGMVSTAGGIKGAKAGGTPQQAQVTAQKWAGVGQAIEGVGESAASLSRYYGAQAEAGQTESRAVEEQLRFQKQTEQDQMQVAHDLLSKARESLNQVLTQMIQTLQNQARNI